MLTNSLETHRKCETFQQFGPFSISVIGPLWIYILHTNHDTSSITKWTWYDSSPREQKGDLGVLVAAQFYKTIDSLDAEFLRNADMNGAIQALEQTIRQDPNNHTYWLIFAQLCAKTQKYEAVIQAYETLRKLYILQGYKQDFFRTISDFWLLISDLYMELQDYEATICYIKEELSREPSYP